MKQIDEKDLARLLESEQESRDIEFKPPFTWNGAIAPDPYNREYTIRNVLAMTNIPRGGRIIIGISEDANHKPIVDGLTDAQFDSFLDLEAVAGTINGFSSTSINPGFAWGYYPRGDGKKAKLIVISMSEFDLMPAMCVKNGTVSGILGKDTLYVRPIKGAGTCKATAREFEEIIQICVNKGVNAQNEDDWYHVSQLKKVLKSKLIPTPRSRTPREYFDKTDKDITNE